MQTNFSKDEIIVLLKKFGISIKEEYEKELDDPNNPFFKELENATLSFEQNNQLIKSLNDSHSIRDQIVRKNIQQLINNAIANTKDSLDLKKSGELGKSLAVQFNLDRLANAAAIKKELLDDGKQLDEDTQLLHKLRDEEKLIDEKLKVLDIKEQEVLKLLPPSTNTKQ